MGPVSLATLNDLLNGHVLVRIDRRTANGLEPVAAGRLAMRARTGHTLQLEDDLTGRAVTVTLTSAHVVAYTPTTSRSA